jgi:site-specific recombinase XerD
MVYAGWRIEETSALTLEDLLFWRGEEDVRADKGSKGRLLPMGPGPQSEHVKGIIPFGRGKIVESWDTFNAVEMMQQPGVDRLPEL